MSDPSTESSAAAPSETAVEASDEILLLGARFRDEDALTALHDRYGGLVFTLALRIVGDHDLAEEVTQDVFLRCWHGLAQYDSLRGTLPSWLFGITRNRAIGLLRGRQDQAPLREHAPLSDEGTHEPSTPDGNDDSPVRAAVGQALAELSGPQREAIELAYYGGLTQTEVADQLGEPPGAVKTRIRDGLRRLRRVLAPMLGDNVAERDAAS
jgi:RNA polymerase sigma-70 factor (ECF subfamily)